MQPDVVIVVVVVVVVAVVVNVVVVVVGIGTGIGILTIGIFTSSAVVIVTKGAIGMVKRVTDRIKTQAVGIIGTT